MHYLHYLFISLSRRPLYVLLLFCLLLFVVIFMYLLMIFWIRLVEYFNSLIHKSEFRLYVLIICCVISFMNSLETDFIFLPN